MTLAVAARFPWPGLIDTWPENIRKVMGAFPELGPQAGIVMTADSRWYFPDRGTSKDGAVKVVAISATALAIYAGDTAIGPRALGRLTDELRRASHATPQKIARLGRESLTAVWRRFALQDSVVQVAIGAYDPRSGFNLWRYDHVDGFRPREQQGIVTLGSSDGRVAFYEELRRQIEQRVSQPLDEVAFAAGIEEWAIALATALYQTSARQADPTVGGPMLVAYLTRSGVQGLSLHVVTADGDRVQTTQISLTAEQIDSFQKDVQRPIPEGPFPRRRSRSETRRRGQRRAG